jgi:diadenosine tetraphosphate (Ap4A) HIT family hydrolase
MEAECVICAKSQPDDVVADLDAVWVTVPPMTPLRGYVCLVAKRHVREPFELPDPERQRFWADVDRVAAAISAGFRPDKLNYEIHGNTIPHLHLHLFPRWEGDRFTGLPIDWREAERRTDEERAEIAEVLAGFPRS